MTKKRTGHILVFSLVVLGILFTLTSVSLQLVHREGSSVNRSYVAKQTLNLAEAGIEHAIRQLNSNNNYTGEIDTPLGNGTFTVSVTGSSSTRTIEATGYVPNSTNPITTRTVKAEASLDSDNVEFFYGIQVDGGGISMTNSATVVGNVYSNGSIIGSNGATITGDATVAGGLADDPSVSSTIENADHPFATASGNRDIAQSFTASTTASLTKVSVLLGKVGNPTSNLSVRIATDVSNRPNTSSLATSIISYASVGLTPSWIDVTFNTPPSLSNGTKYWIVLDYGSNSATNYWNWRKDTADTYANNTGKYTSNCCSGTPTWTNVGGDLGFKVWLGGTITRIDGMTIGSSSNGVARANQIVNSTVHGSACPNAYCIIENPPAQAMPISDGNITDWKNDAAAGGTYVGNYNISGTQQASLGPKKIQGDLMLSNSSILTVTGTLWVTGNIYVSNSSTIRLDPGYGANSGIVLTDGTITVSNSAIFQGAGTGSYVLLLTARDAKSQTSIFVSNASTGVIYYAGKSWIQFSNSATAKEATAWGITLSNSSTVTYESGLANMNFTSGPGAGWQLKKGTWREINN